VKSEKRKVMSGVSTPQYLQEFFTFRFSFMKMSNNRPILIGFYPILNDNALSGLWFEIEGKIAFVVKFHQKTLKGLQHLG
jgi:hypothetical protein